MKKDIPHSTNASHLTTGQASKIMKNNIHPTYYNKAIIKCACGNEIIAGSAKEKISVEICSACHPFFTGKKKLIDTAGRVEKFKTRRAKARK